MASPNPVDLVTGAFGNTGSRIAAGLAGRTVRTLTGHAPADPGAIEVYDWGQLAQAFAGVDTFYNTFWMRTGNPGSDGTDYSEAVARSKALLEAATAAGVRRIVHLSVANADDPRTAEYAYFRGKAEVERAVAATGIPHAIVRPALIFGGGPGLVEQLAYVIRRVPVMGVAGDGNYRVRPVHVDDVVALCLAGGAASDTSVTDAVGPDRPTFEELARAVAAGLGKKRVFLHLPTAMVITSGKLLGKLARQELLTGDELRSTMEGVADTDGPATGSVSVLAWIAEQGRRLG